MYYGTERFRTEQNLAYVRIGFSVRGLVLGLGFIGASVGFRVFRV